MTKIYERTKLIIGEEGVNRLNSSSVLIFGVGGVGGYTCEALARAGIGTIGIVDNDIVNRQIIALSSTVGRLKVDVMEERIKDINNTINVNKYPLFYRAGVDIDMSAYDYIVDAVDTVTAKLLIIENAKKAGVPVISSMGAGNKLDPADFQVADISETSVCPLAKVMRKELKARGISGVKTVYSKEVPKKDPEAKVPGSISFVPSAAGLIIAGEVVKDLLK